MADQLKNILHFSLPSGGSQTLPHGLNVQNGRQVIPDHLEASVTGFTFTADDTSVTASGTGDVDVLVEYWHSIERAFGAVGVVALDPHPFIPDNGGGGGIPTPPFDVVTTTIYARTTGSDTTGNGHSPATAYRTLQRAVRDVPLNLPPGAIYVVDITGITETLPVDYILPAWKAPQVHFIDASGPFRITNAVNIVAIPESVPLTPQSDSTINQADIVTSVPDPVTGLITITIAPARASWGANALKGKQIQGAVGGVENAVIYESTTTTISITATTEPTRPIQIVQPSATLLSADPASATLAVISALNCDSIAFSGLRITSGGIVTGLYIDGSSQCTAQMCELDSPIIESINSLASRIIRNWIYGFPFFASNGLFFNQGLMDGTSGAIFASEPCSTAVFVNMVLDGCDPIDPQLIFGSLDAPLALSSLAMNHVLIRNGSGDGVSFHGAVGTLENVDIYGCAGNGITVAHGSGLLQLQNVRGSGAANGGFGLQIDDGMCVQADAATSAPGTPLSGTGGQTKTGALAAQTWADFLTGGANTFDITATAPTGATGTGSRLYQ